MPDGLLQQTLRGDVANGSAKEVIIRPCLIQFTSARYIGILPTGGSIWQFLGGLDLKN